MTADFTDILSKKPSQIEKPRPKPTGTYISVIQGMPKQKTVTVQGEERKILSFSCKVMAAASDVDQELLSESGDLSSWMPFNKDIWIDTPEGEYQLRQFLNNTLAIEAGEGKNEKSLGEQCTEAPGKQLLITLKHRPFMNKEQQPEIATEIGATAAV